MSDIEHARKALLKRILEGEGNASESERRAAFNNTAWERPGHSLVDKVAKDANRITDDDIATAKASGLSEDQIFELVVCAAVGQATRQYEAGITALHQVVGEV